MFTVYKTTRDNKRIAVHATFKSEVKAINACIIQNWKTYENGKMYYLTIVKE